MRKLLLVFSALLVLVVLSGPAAAQSPRPIRYPLNTYDIAAWLMSAQFTRTRTVDPGGRGDFRSLSQAVAFVTSQSPTAEKPWLIVVYGGLDNSMAGVSIPDFVTVTYYGSTDNAGNFVGLEIEDTGENGLGMKVMAPNGIEVVSDGFALHVVSTGPVGIHAQINGVSGEAIDADAGEGANAIAVRGIATAGSAAWFERGEGAAGTSNTVTIIRDSTGNQPVAGDLLHIVDIPGGSGTKAGDLIAARSNSGGTEAEKFAVARDGTVRLPGGCKVVTGSGSPESVVTAPVCSLYLRLDGGATTTLYVKTSGAGNTGWTSK